MKYMRFALLLAVMLCCTDSHQARAQRNDDGEFMQHNVELTGMVTTRDLLYIDFAYHYKVNAYVGVGGSLGVFTQYVDGPKPAGDGWRMDGGSCKETNVYLRPSVQFFTPMLLNTGGIEWRLYAEPGVMLFVPYRKAWVNYVDAHGHETGNCEKISVSAGQWIAPDCKAGVMIRADRFNIALGVCASSLDAYSSSRHLRFKSESLERFYPDRKVDWGFYASIAYNF